MAPASNRIARLALLALASGLALVVLVLAWPRCYAALRYQPVDLAIAGYYRGEGIATERDFLHVAAEYLEGGGR